MSMRLPGVNMGNVISAATILVAVVISWQVVVADVRLQSQRLDALDQRVTVAERKLDEAFAELAKDRLQITSVLTELQADMRYLRQAIDELKASEVRRRD